MRAMSMRTILGAALAIGFAAPATASDSLTIGTYNTHLVPDTLRCAEQVDVEALLAAGAIGMVGGTLVVFAVSLSQALQLADCILIADDISYAEAGPIADAIIARNLDVIALNEVFDEDARERLMDRLSPTYPHVVEYINSGPDLEDSGLMLFSKFPFGNLPDSGAVFTEGTVRASTDQVGFVEYDSCDGFDCLSSKGAAFVRIRNTRPGASIQAWDVAFTHMQAAYDSDDENADTRKEQFGNLRDLVNEARNGDTQTPLFILGDLNVEGETGWWDAAGGATLGGAQEWKDFADSANGDPQVTDAWAATTSMLDAGITNHAGELGDMRLDYVLNNQVEIGPCMQHMTLAYLGNSDHIAVLANTNRNTDFCSPRTAFEKPPLDTHLENPSGSGPDRTRIAAPGAMQWYHVVLPETATGAALGTTRPFDPTTGAGVRIELFAPQDLSRPIPPTSRELFEFGEVKTQKYVLPRDFYVRVFSPTPSWTGEYDLYIHELTCASREEACPLNVNDPRRYDTLFNPNVALGPDDTAWFEIAVTDRADSNKEQTLRIFADEFVDGLIDAELWRAPAGTDPFGLNAQTVMAGAGSVSIGGTLLGPQRVYLTLRRNSVSEGTPVRVGWESNLTRIGGSGIGISGARSAVLVCDDETNGFLGSEAGEDEISLMVRVDMTAFREIVYHEFDCNNGGVQLNLDQQLGTIRFIDELVFALFERDSGSLINPDDEGQWNIEKPLPVGKFPPSQDIAAGVPNVRIVRSTDFARWDFEGGKYHLEYNVSNQAQSN